MNLKYSNSSSAHVLLALFNPCSKAVVFKVRDNHTNWKLKLQNVNPKEEKKRIFNPPLRNSLKFHCKRYQARPTERRGRSEILNNHIDINQQHRFDGIINSTSTMMQKNTDCPGIQAKEKPGEGICSQNKAENFI